MGPNLPNILPGAPGDGINYNLETLSVLMRNIVALALGVAGGIAIIFIIIGAYNYLTAYGNEDKANQGKKTITYAIVGLVVIVLAEVIVTIVWSFVSGENPTFIF